MKGLRWLNLSTSSRQARVERVYVTLKQQIHHLVDKLPDDSPLLIEVREALRLNQAISEAVEDVRNGRTYSADEFMAKVQQRWPHKSFE